MSWHKAILSLGLLLFLGASIVVSLYLAAPDVINLRDGQCGYVKHKGNFRFASSEADETP